ncbi:hypothetical protein, partial [Rhodopirellula bahusiensis]|uniref:hypothetical protein n=1 Tax=Rhodopirellula bahusiensis TaxID=2014065 RepID=UPI0032985C00
GKCENSHFKPEALVASRLISNFRNHYQRWVPPSNQANLEFTIVNLTFSIATIDLQADFRRPVHNSKPHQSADSR